MLIDDLLHTTSLQTISFDFIKRDCSQFIAESQGIPIYKRLPSSYGNVNKIKARFKKKNDVIGAAFNDAFSHKALNIRQRAIICQSLLPTSSVTEDVFYILPKNNYKFIYCKEVKDSSDSYSHIIDTLVEYLSNDTATDIVKDLLNLSYTTVNLYEGIAAKSEIIFYGVPYYYAIRATQNINYNQIIY